MQPREHYMTKGRLSNILPCR